MIPTVEEIREIETKLSLSLPTSLKEVYLNLKVNDFEQSYFTFDGSDYEVAELLPLKAERYEYTAMSSYRNLVLSKGLRPNAFFPFAVDSGGDYYFVDCSRPDGTVSFFQGEYWPDEQECVTNFGLGFKEFWHALKKYDNAE